MYCSLDKIDLAATVEGRYVAIQTDHRSTAEIQREPELSVLFAMARVLNARHHVAEEHPGAAVHYVVVAEPPDVLQAALRAVGATVYAAGAPTSAIATLSRLGNQLSAPGTEPSELVVGELADRCFRELAQRTAARIGTRDLAIGLRMLEDQTFAAPPSRDDEAAYWQRVLELAALAGELLRAKATAGHWVQTDRALVPFGFQLATTATGGSTVMFPTNRAQRVIEDGRDESLFKLLLAADETLRRPPDAATGRLMPSLRDRRNVELDEIVWDALLDEGTPDLPIVVCGIDGESTFGMIRREALERPAETALAEALENLAVEAVQTDHMQVDDVPLVVVSGSFYAAEKLLDRAFMRELETALHDSPLAAATPARGLLLVTPASDAAHVLRFTALARARFAEAGGRAISPAVLLVEDGAVVGCVHEDDGSERADARRADTSPETPRRTGILGRLRGRRKD